MKVITLAILLLGFAGVTVAIDKPELDRRIRTLTAKFDALQSKPDKRIPAETLRAARGIVLLDRTKAGFIFAYQGGGGVAMAKDPETEKWSALAFLGADEASLGFQVGGQQTFFVILLMTTNATRLLTEPNFEFGGEARGTGGDTTAGVEKAVTSPERSILIYDDRKGLYGGVSVKGGAISPDNEANRLYYGQALTTKDILFEGKVQPTAAATDLAARLTEHAKTARK